MNMDHKMHGQAMYDFANKIFPYCRSITGDGVRRTIADIKEYIEAGTNAYLNVYEIPSGTQVLDRTKGVGDSGCLYRGCVGESYRRHAGKQSPRCRILDSC